MKTTENIYGCIPHRLFDWETNPETGQIVIIRPKYNSSIGKMIFEPFLKIKNFKIKLDDLGSVVWENSDGQKNVKEIGEILAAKFGSDIEPIYERLSKFLIQMHKGKFIRLDCPVS